MVFRKSPFFRPLWAGWGPWTLTVRDPPKQGYHFGGWKSSHGKASQNPPKFLRPKSDGFPSGRDFSFGQLGAPKFFSRLILFTTILAGWTNEMTSGMVGIVMTE